MARLDQERVDKLQPKRMSFCKRRLEELGFTVEQLGEAQLKFEFNGSPVSFWPYSGWFSGKTVKDNRGFKNLLKELNIKK